MSSWRIRNYARSLDSCVRSLLINNLKHHHNRRTIQHCLSRIPTKTSIPATLTGHWHTTGRAAQRNPTTTSLPIEACLAAATSTHTGSVSLMSNSTNPIFKTRHLLSRLHLLRSMHPHHPTRPKRHPRLHPGCLLFLLAWNPGTPACFKQSRISTTTSSKRQTIP